MPTLQPVEDEMNEEAAAAAGGAPTLAASATPKDSAGKTIAPKKPGLTQPQLEKELFQKLRSKAETKLGAPGSSVPTGPIIINQPIASAPPKPQARAHQKTAVPSASTSRKRVHQPKKIQPTSTSPLQQRPKLPLHGGKVKLPSTSMSPQQYIAKSKLPLNNNGAPKSKSKSKFKLPLILKGAPAATNQHSITEQTKNVPLTSTNKPKRKSPLPLSLPRTQPLPTTTTKPKRKPPPPPGPPPATWPGPAITTTRTTPKSKVTTKALLHCQLNMKRPPPPPGPPPSPSEGAAVQSKAKAKAKTATSSSSLSPSTTKRNNNNLLPTTQQQIAHQKSLAEQRRREAQKQTPITLTELDMNEKEINESKSLLMCFLSGMDDDEKEEIIVGNVSVSTSTTSLHVVDEFQHDGRNHDKAYHYSDPTRLDKKMKGR